MDENKMPSEIEAEIAIIGSIFLEPSLILQISDLLLPIDFYDYKHQQIYKTMINLSRSGKQIDPATIISSLSANSLLEQCGGFEYIDSLSMHSYSTANIDTYIDLVKSASMRRNAIQALQQLSQDGYKVSITTNDYLENIEKAILDISKNRRAEKFVHLKEVCQEILDDTTKNAESSKEVIGLDTGYVGLNRITQGFQNGALYILAARPAMGKTAFALNLAMNISERNKSKDFGGSARVAYFSLEMAPKELTKRMIAAQSNIPLKNIISYTIRKEEWTRYTTGCSKLSELNIYFDENVTNFSNIKSKCRRLKSEDGLDFIIVDYLQLIPGDKKNETEYEKVTTLSRGLKLLARELEVPVLALSQLSREVEKREDKHPIMADLRSSGSIEQDADMIMFLYRDEVYNKASTRKGEADLIVSKNRSGNTTSDDGMPFIFNGEVQSFNEKR